MPGSLSLKSNLLSSPFIDEPLWGATLLGLPFPLWDGPVKVAEAGAQDPDTGSCSRHTEAVKSSWLSRGVGDRRLKQGVEFLLQYLR